MGKLFGEYSLNEQECSLNSLHVGIAGQAALFMISLAYISACFLRQRSAGVWD